MRILFDKIKVGVPCDSGRIYTREVLETMVSNLSNVEIYKDKELIGNVIDVEITNEGLIIITDNEIEFGEGEFIAPFLKGKYHKESYVHNIFFEAMTVSSEETLDEDSRFIWSSHFEGHEGVSDE